MVAELLPDSRLVEIRDSYALIMRDQPHAFATAVAEFVRETAAGAGGPAPVGREGAVGVE